MIFDKIKHISHYVIAVGIGEQCVLLKSYLSQELQRAGVCSVEDILFEDNTFILNDIITNSEDIPKDAGIYDCTIEITGGEAYFNGSETDYNDVIITIDNISDTECRY